MKDLSSHSIILFLSLLIVIVLPHPGVCDKLIMKNGKAINCIILDEKEDSLFIDRDGHKITLSKSLIEEIQRDTTMTREEFEGDQAFRRDNLNEAKKWYTKALERLPDNPRISEKIKKVELLILEREKEKSKQQLAFIDELINSGKYDEAIIEIEKFEESEDSSLTRRELLDLRCKIHYLKGMDALNSVNYKATEAEFRKALSFCPDKYIVLLELADVLRRNYAARLEAITLFQKGLRLAGNNLESTKRSAYLILMGNLQMGEGHYAEAKDAFLESKNLSGEIFSVIDEKIATCYIRLAQKAKNSHPQKALNYYTEALKFKSDDPGLYIDYANLLRNTNRTEEALELYNRLIKLDSRMQDVHYLMGMCYLDLHIPEKAQAEFERELSINPANYDALCELANLMFLSQQYNNALEYFNRAIGIDPIRPRGYLGRGMTYRKMKRYSFAKIDFNEILRSYPRHAIANFELGQIYLEEQEFQKAANLFDRALDSFEKTATDERQQIDKILYAEMISKRGIVARFMGSPRGALEYFKRSLEQNPNYYDAYFHMADAYLDLKQYNTAEKYYKYAISFNPEEPRYHLGLGILYQRYLKKLHLAIESYTQYIKLGGADVYFVNQWIIECGGTPVEQPPRSPTLPNPK